MRTEARPKPARLKGHQDDTKLVSVPAVANRAKEGCELTHGIDSEEEQSKAKCEGIP
jgi:hypothetical protein